MDYPHANDGCVSTFEGTSRNWTHNLRNAGWMLQPPSYKNSWWLRSLVWTLLHTKWPLLALGSQRRDFHSSWDTYMNAPEQRHGGHGFDSYLELWKSFQWFLQPLSNKHHLHHSRTSVFNAILSFICMDYPIRAVFKWLSKVITRMRLLLLVIG